MGKYQTNVTHNTERSHIQPQAFTVLPLRQREDERTLSSQSDDKFDRIHFTINLRSLSAH